MSIEETALAYVLGALTAAERDGVMRERLYHRALDAEIGKMEQAYAALNAGSARLPDAEGLWRRIGSALVRETRELAESRVEECIGGDWQMFGPGIEFKKLWSPKALLIRCIPGAFEEAHDQPEDEDEHIVVVAGDLVLGGRRFGTGDYIGVPAGTLHGRMTTSGGCILFTEYRPVRRGE